MTATLPGVPTFAPVEGDSEHREPAGGIATTVATSGENHESMVSVRLFRSLRGHGVGLTTTEPAPAPPPRPTVLARTLALAHRLQAMIDNGTAEKRADLAIELGFTRPRITQIMGLLLLAPDIQEDILFSVSLSGRDVITTRDVRPIVRVPEWAEQRELWQLLRNKSDAG